MAKEITIDLDETTSASSIVSTGSKDQSVIDVDAGQVDTLPEGAVVNDDGTVTLTLDYPPSIQIKENGKVSEKTYETMTFHRLTGADVRAISSAPAERQPPTAFARSTRTPEVVMFRLFDLMDMVDIGNCGRVLNYFLSSGRKTRR